MPCYKPLAAQMYVSGRTGSQTVRVLKRGDPKQNAELPCSKCLGCRLEKAKEWALRCYHESIMHERSSFLTLTYDDQHLPGGGVLIHAHFQRFMKRLRRRTDLDLRYYMCGEYGETTGRPHYHCILFGYDFPDKTLVNIRNGNRVYVSRFLSSLWPYGSSEIGSVTFKSAGYVARYVLKKQTYGREIIDHDTGEWLGDKPEPYTRMSLKPAIGKSWYEKYKDDLFPHGYAVLPDGRQTQIPGYYLRLLAKEDPELFEQLREARIEQAKMNPNNTPERLAVREQCKQRQVERLTRTL